MTVELKSTMLFSVSDSLKDFISQEMTWFSSLDNSQWLLNISRCFQCVGYVIDKMSTKCQSIILKGEVISKMQTFAQMVFF